MEIVHDDHIFVTSFPQTFACILFLNKSRLNARQLTMPKLNAEISTLDS